MSVVPFLIVISICLGIVGLVAFFWSLRSGQYEDLDGAAERILFDDDEGPAARTRESSRQADRK
ncbi:MAG: cbb3-type cytochrome oxidase assembly protein CcoS [Alphaproteobacteria bacterium]